MASPERSDYKKNPYLIEIRLNEWIGSKTYKGCTIHIIGQNHYKLFYGTEIQYTAWVEIFKVDNRWVYTPLGNIEYQSQKFDWLGDLFDVAIPDMIGSKL